MNSSASVFDTFFTAAADGACDEGPADVRSHAFVLVSGFFFFFTLFENQFEK